MTRLEVDGVTHYASQIRGTTVFYMPNMKDGWHLAGWLREDGTYTVCETEALMQKLVTAWRLRLN